MGGHLVRAGWWVFENSLVGKYAVGKGLISMGKCCLIARKASAPERKTQVRKDLVRVTEEVLNRANALTVDHIRDCTDIN